MAQVEDVLFKVWDGPFRRHSDTFCKMYSLRTRSDLEAAAAAGVTDASGYDTDAGALYIPNVTADDFERLLWILIPPVIGQCKAHTIPDWSAILALSTQWGFHTTRAVALRELEEFDIEPVRKIVLAQRCGAPPRWAAGAMQRCAHARRRCG
ncbi:hypothetical protein BD779DRAFT_1673456 [Infundibulicybe gibba]|nr:hypothetical protein BD779DRAFT_1673456 [Infundibulicybe gibba]